MYTCTHMYVYMRTRTRTDTHTQARPCTRALLLSLASRSTEMLEHRAHRTGRMHDPNEGMFRACTTPQRALEEGATYHRAMVRLGALGIRGRRLGGLRGLTRLGRGCAPHATGDHPRLTAVLGFRFDYEES